MMRLENHDVVVDPKRRHDFVLIWDVEDGNPNGDPDAGNLPRVDPETMHGMVTDVAVKRKLRNWVQVEKEDEPPYAIYVKHHGVLGEEQSKAYEALDLEPGTKSRSSHAEARDWMCRNFYDIRTFGAVMNVTDFNCGQVRGPMQLTFGRSFDPIVPLDLGITRVAITNPEGTKGQKEQKRTEMGRKTMIPYGLYRARGFYNPNEAGKTNFTQNDLELFWQGLLQMWQLDRSATRGYTACRGLWIFSHDDAMGRAPAHELFNLVIDAIHATNDTPRSISDYHLPSIDDVRDELPDGVTVTQMT